MTTIWRRMLTACLALCTLFGFGGCVYDRLDECRGGGDRDIVVTFRIASSDVVNTKAIIGTENGTAAENWIDQGTIKFLLFNGYGAFLQDISAVAETKEMNETWDLYTVKASFKESYFSSPSFSGGNVPFKLMVLANWPESALGQLTGNCNTIKEAEASGVSFELPDGYGSFPLFGTSGIPMYGLLDCSVPQASLDASSEDNYVELGDVYMMRSLAKIEFIDMIEASDERGYPRITRVEMSGYNGKARLIPADFRNGVQVSSPTYPDGVFPVTDGIRFSTDSGNSRKLFAYIPETPSSDLKFRITISYSGTSSRNYELSADKSNGAWGTSLLRNHIYRVSVTHATEIDWAYTVCPWDDAEVELPPYEEN